MEYAPDLAGAHGKLGDLLTRKGLVDQAAGAYRHYFECLGNISKMVLDNRRKDEGITQYLIAIGYTADAPLGPFTAGRAAPVKESPRNGPAPVGLRCRAEGRPRCPRIDGVDPGRHEAFQRSRRRAQLRRDCRAQAAATYVAEGEILFHQGDTVGAVECYRRALEVDPNSTYALGHLGTALRTLGRFEEAAACYEKILKIGPDLDIAYASLATIGKLKRDSSEIQQLLSRLDQPDLSIDNRIAVGFALAKAFDDSGRFDEAFARYAEANALVKQQRTDDGNIYDPKLADELIGQLLDVFSAEYFRKRMDWGEPSELPVFVCGMPRSGSTLIQQIAASHPQIHGAGNCGTSLASQSALEEPTLRPTRTNTHRTK